MEMPMSIDTWVLVRGLSRESQHWGRFAEKLSGRVIFLDWPGLGCYYHQTMPKNPDACVDFFERQLSQLIKDQVANIGIIGLSLGGALALYWSKRYPDRFAKVVVINSSLANVSFFWHRLSFFALKQLFKIFLNPSITAREEQIYDLTSNISHAHKKEIVREWINIAKHHSIKRSTFIRQLFLGSTIKVEKPLPVTPIILASKHDALVSFKTSQALSEYFAAPLYVHPLAGHDLPLDDPDWCINHILS